MLTQLQLALEIIRKGKDGELSYQEWETLESYIEEAQKFYEGEET